MKTVEDIFDAVGKSLRNGIGTMDEALDMYGPRQIMQAIEEYSELIIELARVGKDRQSMAKIRSEIADVLIMSIQLAALFSDEKPSDITDQIDAKIERLQMRLGEKRAGVG